jgi:hypothetical protein
MRKTFLAALLVTGFAAAPLAAQTKPAPAATSAGKAIAGNTAEDRARAGLIFRTFSIAINSDKVKPEVKNQLVACLYNNPIRQISVATGGVFEKNKNLDPKKPEQVYSVAARLCGVKPATAANTAAPAKTPAKAAAQAAAAQPPKTTGR